MIMFRVTTRIGDFHMSLFSVLRFFWRKFFKLNFSMYEKKFQHNHFRGKKIEKPTSKKTNFFEKICEIIRILKFSFSNNDNFSIFFLENGCAEIFFYAKLSQTSKKIICEITGKLRCLL